MHKKKLLGCYFHVVIVIVIVLLLAILVTFAGGPVGSKLLELVGIHFQLPALMSIGTPEPVLAAESLFYV